MKCVREPSFGGAIYKKQGNFKRFSRPDGGHRLSWMVASLWMKEIDMLRAQFLVDAVPADDAAVCELMLALLGIHSVKSVRDQLYELPPQAQSILSALADTGGELTARDLAKQTGYSQDIVRALLSRAVAAGGAERVREGCSQGRSKVATTYRITERGRHLVVKNER